MDVSKVIAEDPTAATDMDHPAWTGSAYWGEPLFGYYMTEDEWVIRRHIEMLGFADVDFLVFDTTYSGLNESASNNDVGISGCLAH